MAKRQVYKRDSKGRFARTGTGTVRRATTTKKTTTARKRTTTVKKATPAKKAAPRARRTTKPSPFSAAGVAKATKGKRVRSLAQKSGLSQAETQAILKRWKAQGVEKRLTRNIKPKARRKGPKVKAVPKTYAPGSTIRSQPTLKRPWGWD